MSTVNGEKITIKASGEEAAVGDEVVKEDGSPVEDGEVIVDLGEEGKLILVIKDGKIAEFKEYTEEVKTEEEVSRTPDEFSKRLRAVEQSLGEIKTMLSRQTKTPAQQNAMTLASLNNPRMTRHSCLRRTDAELPTKLCRDTAQRSNNLTSNNLYDYDIYRFE